MKKLAIAQLENLIDYSGAHCNSAIGGAAALVIVVIGVNVISHKPK